MSGKSHKVKISSKSRGWLGRNLIKAVIAVAAIGALALITKIPPKKRDVPPAPAPPVNVTAMTVVADPELADTFELPAVIEPNRVVTVSAEVDGRIEHIPSKEGSMLSAGDLLIQINADLIRPAFEIAEAQVARNQIERDRMKRLVDDDATSQRDLDDAETQLAISKARLEEARSRLERTSILAPLDGVLNNLLVEEGEHVSVGNPVAEIVETKVLKVVVEVPERDIVFFDVGQPADVSVHTRDGEKQLSGPISFISEVADPYTRSTRVEITLDNEKGLVRSGQIVSVSLTRRVLKDAVLIPLLAVVPMEEGNSVYVVNSHEAKRRNVELGIIKGDMVLIKSGLKPGDRLIIEGHRFVAPGQKVNITEIK